MRKVCAHIAYMSRSEMTHHQQKLQKLQQKYPFIINFRVLETRRLLEGDVYLLF